MATALLPAVSVHEKGCVLEGSEICRILPTNDSGSVVKIRDLPTRTRFCASATCGFVAKNRCVLDEFRFFPTLLLRTGLAIAQYNPSIALTGKPIHRLD